MPVVIPVELAAYYKLVGDVLYVPWGWVGRVRHMNAANRNLFVTCLWRP